MNNYPTIRKGDKGEAVCAIQRALGVQADGIFGTGTEAAVKAFQRSHGLVADGIVGPKTWAALGTGGTKAVDPAVVYSPLRVHVTKALNRPIRYIAIHYTAGASSKAGSARAVKRVFEQRKASADFAVDDAEMVQFNPDLRNYYCWAVGDRKNPYSGGGRLYRIATNRNTISIEICSTLRRGTSAGAANHDGWSLSAAAVANAVKLTRILMAKYGVPLDRVVRHYDVSGKLCPGVPGWNDAALCGTDGRGTARRNDSKQWEEFRKKLL
jgi:hypothetical protein